MTRFFVGRNLAGWTLAVVLAGASLPVAAQDSDSRIRRLEAEVRALKREISPDGARTVAPQAVPQTGSPITAPPATTAVSDLLIRVDALESQLTRLTALNEESDNRVRQLEDRLERAEAALQAPVSLVGQENDTGIDSGSDTAGSANLAAMSSSAPAPRPAQVASPAPRPAPAAAAPSAQRLAAVQAIVKPQTDNPGDDEYSYGFRLWDAKFYPEAQQQLKLFLDKYPRHERVSWARNLMGRALLDEGKPREAATWFLQNYQADKLGARAPDSLLYLAETMRQLNDKNRACIALGEFAETYPAEATGRLNSLYSEVRQGTACN